MSQQETVHVWTEQLVLPTCLPAPPDKNPMFLEKRVYQGSSGRVYPLPFTDRIAERPVDHVWTGVWIENEFLRVLVLPEIGGRIHRLLDKTTGYDLIYHQPVIKPALVGLAGPWISGGIEFNWPQHHRPATFLPVDFHIEKHADGSATIWCGDHDPLQRMKSLHGVCLHPGRALLELKVRVCNRTPLPQTFLWWANVAVRVHEAYQSFFPPDVHYVADHARRSMSAYPLARGCYYGVNYGARARRGVPPDDVPSQFIPPHCRPKSEISNLKSEIPCYAPNDLSFYANIPVPTSYMCLGSQGDFFGGYDHKARVGIVHVANHHIAPGKKQWTWGNHEFGYAWDRNLTDPDARGQCAPYIELMAGVYTDNQPDFSFLQPGETKTWSQFWYPIHQIGPAQHANRDAAVSWQRRGGRANGTVRIGVAVTAAQPKARIIVEPVGGRLRTVARPARLPSFRYDLAPGQPLVAEFRLPQGARETDLRLRVTDSEGREIISHQPQPRPKGPIPPPATEPPPPRAVASTDELFLTGLHLDQYRHATRCPTLYWREALRRDPLDARCNHAMALWHLKRGEFTQAEAHFRRAIARLTRRNANPADGEPFYHLGLCLRYLGREAEAYNAFYKACWNQAWAAAGYHALAEMDCARQDWPTALEHLNRSLAANADNLRARNLKAIVLRKLAAQASARSPASRAQWERAARAVLRETLARDPLDWWAQHLIGQPLTCDAQTALDLALDCARAGLFAEAIALLEARATAAGKRRGTGDPRELGAAPLVHYHLGWLHEQLARTLDRYPHDGFLSHMRQKSVRGGNAQTHRSQARAQYRQGAAASPDYCFPARLEEIAILEAAMRANPNDARAPCYLGNLLYDRRRHTEAIRLWERSARLDPGFSVVWRSLGIGYFNIRRQPTKARAAYERAVRANPHDARLLYERDQLWKRLGQTPEKRLRELERRLDLVRQRDDLSVELCALYNQTGHHEKALALLGSRHFQPWEGGEGGPLGQWSRTHLALGRAALRAGDPATAREHFQAALTAPRHLGEARHLLANQSEVHFWLGYACHALGDGPSARRHWRAAATFRGDFQEMSVRAFSEMTYYSARAWEQLGRKDRARHLFQALLRHARRLRRTPAKIDYFATSLPTMLLFEDDLQFRQETTALFLEAQARLGLGQPGRAHRLLRLVLKRDPNHALAADLRAEQGWAAAGRRRH